MPEPEYIDDVALWVETLDTEQRVLDYLHRTPIPASGGPVIVHGSGFVESIAELQHRRLHVSRLFGVPYLKEWEQEEARWGRGSLEPPSQSQAKGGIDL